MKPYVSHDFGAWAQTFHTHRGGGQTFLHTSGVDINFYSKGWGGEGGGTRTQRQACYVGGGGGNEDVRRRRST